MRMLFLACSRPAAGRGLTWPLLRVREKRARGPFVWGHPSCEIRASFHHRYLPPGSISKCTHSGAKHFNIRISGGPSSVPGTAPKSLSKYFFLTRSIRKALPETSSLNSAFCLIIFLAVFLYLFCFWHLRQAPTGSLLNPSATCSFREHLGRSWGHRKACSSFTGTQLLP